MNINDQELSKRIKFKFGTAPNEPNEQQLANIKLDILFLVTKGITPTESDWFTVIKKHCPNAGNYRYKGADNSDLITLLSLATKK